jgi:hypothetical protein
MNGDLKKDFTYFLEHRTELVQKYDGKVIVIFDGKVEGVYDTELEAVAGGQKKHALGTFLVQKVEPGTDSFTQTFHSRVAFA